MLWAPFLHSLFELSLVIWFFSFLKETLKRKRCDSDLCFGFLLGVLLHEPLDAARGINQFLFARKERMAAWANFNFQELPGFRRAGLKCISTNACNCHCMVFGVNSGSHWISYLQENLPNLGMICKRCMRDWTGSFPGNFLIIFSKYKQLTKVIAKLLVVAQFQFWWWPNWFVRRRSHWFSPIYFLRLSVDSAGKTRLNHCQLLSSWKYTWCFCYIVRKILWVVATRFHDNDRRRMRLQTFDRFGFSR